MFAFCKPVLNLQKESGRANLGIPLLQKTCKKFCTAILSRLWLKGRVNDVANLQNQENPFFGRCAVQNLSQAGKDRAPKLHKKLTRFCVRSNASLNKNDLFFKRRLRNAKKSSRAKNIFLSFLIAIWQNAVECKFSAAAPNCEYVFAKREENEREGQLTTMTVQNLPSCGQCKNVSRLKRVKENTTELFFSQFAVTFRAH